MHSDPVHLERAGRASTFARLVWRTLAHIPFIIHICLEPRVRAGWDAHLDEDMERVGAESVVDPTDADVAGEGVHDVVLESGEGGGTGGAVQGAGGGGGSGAVGLAGIGGALGGGGGGGGALGGGGAAGDGVDDVGLDGGVDSAGGGAAGAVGLAGIGGGLGGGGGSAIADVWAVAATLQQPSALQQAYMQQKILRARRAAVQKEIKKEEGKRARRLAVARLLANDDLVTIMTERAAAKAKPKAKAKAKAKSQVAAGGVAVGGSSGSGNAGVTG